MWTDRRGVRNGLMDVNANASTDTSSTCSRCNGARGIGTEFIDVTAPLWARGAFRSGDIADVVGRWMRSWISLPGRACARRQLVAGR